MYKRQLFSAFLVALLPLLAQAESPNLIVNGSFEDGPAAVDDFLPLDPGSTAIRGWTVTRGQLDLCESHWTAADGQRSLDMHGSPGYGGIAQTFRTAKGQRYRVTFALAGSGIAPPVKRLAVSAAGKMQAFTCDSTGTTADNMLWQTKTWEFDAVADETTLELYTLEDTDPYAGPALDNVRVVAVPGGPGATPVEPATVDLAPEAVVGAPAVAAVPADLDTPTWASAPAPTSVEAGLEPAVDDHPQETSTLGKLVVEEGLPRTEAAESEATQPTSAKTLPWLLLAPIVGGPLVLLLGVLVSRRRTSPAAPALLKRRCVHCGKGVKVLAGNAGKRFQCPRCGTIQRLEA